MRTEDVTMFTAAPAWPAPPARSFWSGLTCGPVIVTPATSAPSRPKPKAKPEPRPQPRPNVKVAAPPVRRPRGPVILGGVALKFGEWFGPSIDAPGYEGARVQVWRGALDTSLRLTREGKRTVRLLLLHDHAEELCSTADGSLELAIEGDELTYRVLPRTRAGRRAIRAAREYRGLRQASVGIRWEEAVDFDAGGVRVVTIFRARLQEISLVPEGACPGTTVFVF